MALEWLNLPRVKLKELIGIHEFPVVVQAADVRALRNEPNNEDGVRDFIGGYLAFDERSRHALSTIVSSLSRPNSGGAFFLNGVFGSGKSHLLGLLTLLCDGIGHATFETTHPQFAPALNNFGRSFVVHLALDEYDAAKWPLEEIVQRELAAQWQDNYSEHLEIADTQSRREYFACLEEQLLARGCNSLFIGIDELSLFLSAKDHRELQADAAFLQFLGQRAGRSSACPLHIVAAIQKTVDDIGDIEAYSLSQIRDRFQTLPLSMAHIPSLISHRLITHKNPLALQTVCRESYDELSKALPRLDFGLQEWEALFPYHPATVGLLESIVARFFSRTRSAAIFCSHAAQQLMEADAPATTRVLPDALFDYLLPELENHPELHPLATVWQRWHNEASELAADAAERESLLRLMKTLLLWKIGGVAPTCVQIANAIALDAKLPNDGNYEYARVLLERLLGRGSHLAVERNAGESEDDGHHFADRYTIDLGTRISELARRHLKNALSELRPDDARVATYVVECCNAEPLPLSTLNEERLVNIFWRQAPREIAVQILLLRPSLEAIGNRVAMLQQPGARDDLLLLILPPFSRALLQPQTGIHDPQLIVWSPRTPTADEWQAAREATAAHLLLDDPQLLDNRRGRAILNHLKEARPQRATTVARLARRLLHEGTVQAGDNRVIEASELATGQSWHSALEAIAEFALPHVFPQFESVAPRARVLTPSNADQLCLEVLRRPAQEPYFAASLERIVRAIAEPLGIARADKGRWKITPLRDDLANEFKEFIQDGSTLGALNAHFSISRWGLKAEQISLAVCALLRSGEIIAHDGKGKLLTASQIGMPLQRNVHRLQPGQLLDEERWQQLQSVVALLTADKLGPLSFGEQQRARVFLEQAREELQTSGELLQARVRQLQRTLNHSPSQWPRVESTLQTVAGVVEALKESSDVTGLLRQATALDVAALSPALAHWHELQSQLESSHTEILNTHRLLSRDALNPPPELQSTRADILQRMEAGETVLQDENLPSICTDWRDSYARLYRDWHKAQHDAARWNSLRRLQNSDALRALQLLSTLRSRTFKQSSEIHAAIQEELRKHCPRDGSLLPGEATCNACGLRFAQRVTLRDVREIDSALTHASALFYRGLHEETATDFLARHNVSTPLLHWDGDAMQLLPQLSDEVLALLEEAFRPRRRVTRSYADLRVRFGGCRTRSDFQAAFAGWIDGDELLQENDEIELA